jgi:uncharacterized membrane protein
MVIGAYSRRVVRPSVSTYIPNSYPAHLLFEVEFQNYFTEMITILRQCVGCFYTLNFVCDITLTLQEVYLPVSKTYSGSITRFNRLLFVSVWVKTDKIKNKFSCTMFSTSFENTCFSYRNTKKKNKCWNNINVLAPSREYEIFEAHTIETVSDFLIHIHN